MSELLDIVDDNDVVIGQAERDVAHAQGLTIRLVYVWFYTPGGEVILQRRSAHKEAYPNRLIATVSGHVGAGDSYLEAAIRETEEETGVAVDTDALQFFGKIHRRTGEARHMTDGFRCVYIYPFAGRVEDLRVEAGEGAGFELWQPHHLLKALVESPDEFTPFAREPFTRELIASIARDSDGA